MELFLRCAELCKEDLSVQADNSLPPDGIIKTMMLEPRILALLFPLRQGGGRKDRDDEVDRLREEVKRLRSSGSKGS
eukprot:11318199-Karenia_brevis.AAC.1